VSDCTAECGACSMNDRQVPLSPAEGSPNQGTAQQTSGLAGQHHDDSRPPTCLSPSDREGVGMLDRHAHTSWHSHHLAGDVDDGAGVAGIDGERGISDYHQAESRVKRAAAKRADRVIIHWNDPAPIHVAAKGVVIEEKVEGRGWQLAEEIDFKQLATLPELVIGRVDGRKSDADVTCFINNIGLGFQFAAAGALVYRKAKESGLGHEVPTDWFTEDVHP